MIDAEQIKRNNDIVQTIGRFVDLKKQGSDYKGCCPFHGERTPSFNVNPNTQSYKCFGCGKGGDVIEFIMEIKAVEFPEACEILGGDITDTNFTPPKKQPVKKKEPAKIVPLDYKAAQDHYTVDALTASSGSLIQDKTFSNAWKYINESGEVEIVVVRWDDSEGKKTVLTYFWNGNSLAMRGYPNLLYNRDRLKNEPEKDVLIVFGEKCAGIVDKHLSDQFIPVTWNGGEKKVNDVDFTPLKNRTVFCWPDDDKPGTVTAEEIKKLIPQVQTVELCDDIKTELRKLEPKGADIYEAWQYWQDAPSIIDYIYKNSKRIEKPQENLPAVSNQAKEEEKPKADFPFEILGIADDGKAYFISDTNRLQAFNPTSISKTQLINLTPVLWWREFYGDGKKSLSKDDWEDAVSDMIAISSVRDFDPDRMRGRGAWREPDGRLCYHDGKNTIGSYDPARLFIRRPQKDIGINTKPATAKQRAKIYDIAGDLTFKSMSDCIRTLGWSILAPFAGALPWRPAGLLTAKSGSGKSTIINKLVHPLSLARNISGAESTAAGTRQKSNVDACAHILEELEGDTKKKQLVREDYFGLIRQSTSDDSPDAEKGTQNGLGTTYKMRGMFMVVCVDPTIEAEADENRFFRISLVSGRHNTDQWVKVETALSESLTPEICSAVRSYTWQNLPEILKLAKALTPKIQKSSGLDNRTSFAEATLIAAHLAVFEDNLNPKEEYLDQFLKDFYDGADTDRIRNENEEMLDSIMDHIVRVAQEKFTIREMIGFITMEIGDNEAQMYKSLVPRDARRELGMHGIGLTPAGDIAIAKNHPEMMKILERGKGYHHQLKRHPRMISTGMNVGLGPSAGTKNCIVIGSEPDES